MFLSSHRTRIKSSGQWHLSRAIDLQQAPLLILTLLLLTPLISISQQLQHRVPIDHVLQQLQPTFTKNMDSMTVKENTMVGEVVYILEAQIDSDLQGMFGVHILYGINGTQLFAVDNTSGEVRVAKPIDREQTSDEITFQVSAVAAYNENPPGQQPNILFGPVTQLNVTVIILDENDNPPKIERVKVNSQFDLNAAQLATARGLGGPVIRINMSESAPFGSVLVELIEAIDVDKVSSNPLRSICFDCGPEFELRPTSDKLLNDRLNFTIVLIEPLVHVPRNNVKKLHVIVNDGKYNSTINFEVTIADVQNKPPVFVGSSTCVVYESVAIDNTIMTIQAVDGDIIGSDETSVPKTGGSNQNGRPILYSLDPEKTTPGASVDFKLHPLTGQLQVANRLDREAYLSVNSVLSLRVQAYELTRAPETIVGNYSDILYHSILEKLEPYIDRSAEAISETDVTVILVDVNDNEPHWLNGSEIMSLNMNKSPNWFSSLPNDRDTGRIYRFQVKENSLVGTPITTKNEMFVYDLDNGENSNFNLTLGDPFNLFDVEPKQVSGFALVTIKLANRGNDQKRTRLLDYENLNERSFIIELIATETNTLERFSSKASIHINVLDVNDNVPEFKESAYHANIREDAPAGKTVLMVQATDKDEVSKQLTYSLHGRSANLFDINQYTGLITVAKCSNSQQQQQNILARSRQQSRQSQQQQQQPQQACLDYEQQRSHHLMIEASDGELSSHVPLTVFVDDASDNAPVFSLSIVDVVIEEGADRLDPPIKIEATDADQSSVLTYSIVEGNFEGIFSINNATGELQLTRPIRISHEDDLATGGDYRQQQLNKMTLIVQATDGVYTANGTIRIDVLDANDNAPKFIRSQYSAEIHETISPGQIILSVRAIDSDRGNNARVSYRIQRGSYGQFEIDESTGAITVARDAREFDAIKRENYTLEVVAYDHGLVSKSSSVLVHIHVIDTIKAAPEFEPQIQRATLPETTLNNTVVHTMSVVQHPSTQMERLVFEPGPIEALDKNGQPVVAPESERLESMFRVATDTGDVVVSSSLDHSFASYINLTIYVSSVPIQAMTMLNGSSSDASIQQSEPSPKSVGYLIIYVEDDNSNAPIFAAPWTPQQPELSFQMLEELPVGSILTQLMAGDVDSKISHFKIEPPNEYFELTSPQSGVIVNRKLIDYDTLMSQTYLTPTAHRNSSPSPLIPFYMSSNNGNNIIQFNVYVYDSGLPQLSAKALVSVEILPVNDWDCKFEQPIYEVRVKENARADTQLIQVHANDADYGEQHNTVRYQLVGDHSDYFTINSKTGWLSVSQRGSVSLDRERLSQSSFVITVIGHDGDQLVVSQDQSSVVKSKVQQQQTVRSCSSTIRIHLDNINDNPPVFSQKIYEATAYDTDASEVPIIKLIIRDEDSTTQANNSTNSSPATISRQASQASVIVNSFRIVAGNINESFNISSTGLIYAIKPLNDSLLPPNGGPIQLRVQVKQQSTEAMASFTDECLVRINLVKINRWGPEWRFNSSRGISVEENSKPGTLVTQLKCVDRDHDNRASIHRIIDHDETAASSAKRNSASGLIRYWIKENGTNVSETNEFKLDPTSGKLVTRVELDRETREFHQLVVACEDNGKPQSLESVTVLFISVLDADDNKPEFVLAKAQESSSSLSNPSALRLIARGTSRGKLSISFNVEEHQIKGLPVGELKAIDRDLGGQFPISYCLVDGNEFQEFSLDKVTGILYTNQTLDRERQSTYDLLIKAINDGSDCAQHMQLTARDSIALQQNSNNTTKSTYGSQITSNNLDKRQKQQLDDKSFLAVKVDVLDINDNAPTFRRPIHRAGVHHRSLMNTLVTQVAAFDPDSGLNGTLSYKISEIIMYKTIPNQNQQQQTSSRKYDAPQNELQPLSKPIKLIQYPFRIDQQGNIYTQQLLTQYQLTSVFVVHLQASERAEPKRTAHTKLEIYVYETGSQLKIRINLHPRLVELYRTDIENLLSNATKYTAIINRARSYHGAFETSSQTAKTTLATTTPSQPQRTDATSYLPVPKTQPGSFVSSDEPSFSNIHLIFVDNFRIVNPNLVMEKFDLTSAQLFMPQTLAQQQQPGANNYQTSDNRGAQQPTADGQARSLDLQQQLHSNEVSSLIDKIALASVQSAEYPSSSTSLAGVDWLESPSVIYVTLTIMLAVIGFLIFLFGCCCTSRIKDHIVKVAMDKLVKQQALQARINEQMMAATNQAAAASLSNGRLVGGQDYILQQNGFMSSFDATKGCVTNNNENMSILQRAIESGEYIDPNYTTLEGHVNMGAHYYDASDIEQQGTNGDVHHEVGTSKQLNGESNGSLSAGEEIEEYHLDGQLVKKSNGLSNGIGSLAQNHPRQRQQIPQNN